MSEESPTQESGAKPPTKKPAAKRTASKPKATAAKKPAARKTPARKPASSKTAAAASQAAAKEPAIQEESVNASETQAQPETERPGGTASSSEEYNASRMVEDLKGRDWGQIIQRALFMFFFGVLAWITLSVAFFLAAAQVMFMIFAGEANSALTRLIKQGGNYIRDVLDYLSFASDECPFPFGRNLPDAD